MNNKLINKIHLIFETKVKIGYDGTSEKYIERLYLEVNEV
ncbi:hypothetical protein J2Y02_001885 [Neobacillus drentensis]|nr:hypothetical protein [Neobacillus drentensis]